jgi:hypothetical protein
LRILGLIGQRETVLQRIEDLCEKKNPRDLKKNQKKIEEDLQIYRTITLYVIEYIQTWFSKNQEKKSYLWNGQDYVLKIGSDFGQLVEKSERLRMILDELNLNHKALCIPQDPVPYLKHFRFNVAERSRSESKSPIPTNVSRSQLDGQIEASSPLPPKVASNFGKILKFERTISLDSGKNDGSSVFFITDLANEKDKSPENKAILSKKNETEECKADEVEHASNLPPLLIEQGFRDRKKKYKKYSEPLCSIRHEDLMEKLQEEKPFYFNELIKKKKQKIDEMGKNSGAAIAASHYGYVQQILAKSNQYLKKIQENKSDIEIPKRISTEPIVQIDPSDDYEDVDVQFPETNMAEDVIRLQRAQQFIADYILRSDSSVSEACKKE